MKLLVLATAAALAASLAPSALANHQASTAQDRASRTLSTLRGKVQTNRHVTWSVEEKAHLARTPTTHRERRTVSAPFLRWLVHYWHRRAYRAMKVLHQQQQAAQAPPVVPRTGSGYQTGLSRIGYANAYCESGGDPYNRHNPKYRGKWQFDQATWDAYAPAGWRGHDPATAPESVQDQAALAVPYDAWPRC